MKPESTVDGSMVTFESAIPEGKQCLSNIKSLICDMLRQYSEFDEAIILLSGLYSSGIG